MIIQWPSKFFQKALDKKFQSLIIKQPSKFIQNVLSDKGDKKEMGKCVKNFTVCFYGMQDNEQTLEYSIRKPVQLKFVLELSYPIFFAVVTSISQKYQERVEQYRGHLEMKSETTLPLAGQRVLPVNMKYHTDFLKYQKVLRLFYYRHYK